MTQQQTPAESRARIKQRRDALEADKAQSDSRILCDRLFIHRDLHRWHHIGIYLAVGNEVNLESFIKECWLQGKTLYAPKIGADKALHFHLYTADGELIRNRFGILEPTSPISHPVEQFDALIVPGVCFDKSGHRIGMGAGYYDRLLDYKIDKPYLKPYLIGVCYDFQVIDSISPEPWDVAMDEVLTP
jgi:5-formyltetrahydrofolate cyclo-ligase